MVLALAEGSEKSDLALGADCWDPGTDFDQHIQFITVQRPGMQPQDAHKSSKLGRGF